MGFIDKVRNTLLKAEKVTDGARGAMSKVIPRPGGDPGGEPARGVVVEVLQGPRESSNQGALYHGVTFRARVDDGPVATVTSWITWPAWLDLIEGRDVPLRVDPASGALLGLDAELYEQEARGRDPEDPATAFPALGDLHGGDESPIEGVTLEQWATVSGQLAKAQVSPLEQDAHAATLGIPPGRWTAINAQWQQRMVGDSRIGVRFSTIYAKELSS